MKYLIILLSLAFTVPKGTIYVLNGTIYHGDINQLKPESVKSITILKPGKTVIFIQTTQP